MSAIIKNLLLIAIVVAFFGMYPRELQQEAPTVFAIASIVVWHFSAKLINYISKNL